MRSHSKATVEQWAPGMWSTDDYIRDWAVRNGLEAPECIVPLKSLHGHWMARIRFDEAGRPVERFEETDDQETAGEARDPLTLS